MLERRGGSGGIGSASRQPEQLQGGDATARRVGQRRIAAAYALACDQGVGCRRSRLYCDGASSRLGSRHTVPALAVARSRCRPPRLRPPTCYRCLFVAGRRESSWQPPSRKGLRRRRLWWGGERIFSASATLTRSILPSPKRPPTRRCRFGARAWAPLLPPPRHRPLHQGLWNQAFFVASGYISHCLRCTLDMVFDEVIYPKSDLAGPDGVRTNIIIGYSISAN